MFVWTLHIIIFVYCILHSVCKFSFFIAYICFVYCISASALHGLKSHICMAFTRISLVPCLAVCPAWPDSPAGQGWERDPDQMDEKDDPGEFMVCKRNVQYCSIIISDIS